MKALLCACEDGKRCAECERNERVQRLRDLMASDLEKALSAPVPGCFCDHCCQARKEAR